MFREHSISALGHKTNRGKIGCNIDELNQAPKSLVSSHLTCVGTRTIASATARNETMRKMRKDRLKVSMSAKNYSFCKIHQQVA